MQLQFLRQRHPDPARVEQALARVRKKVDERFVGYRFGVFLDIGLPAEWQRQAQAAAPRPAGK